MAIHRLNHAVLYVRDAKRSADFYHRVLGFRSIMEFPGAVGMQAEGSTNDHDLLLITVGADAAPSSAGRGSVGMYHLGWEVDTLADLVEMERRLAEEGALVGATDHETTKAIYGRDPDGLDFEVCWLVPADLITEDMAPASRHLDLQREIERYGAHTPGGIGVSRPKTIGA